jgi:hypothetical protein
VCARVAEDNAQKCNNEINGHQGDKEYYLADDTRYETFVKTIPNPQIMKISLCKNNESVRKDVERPFGVIQARWLLFFTMLEHDQMLDVMTACLIMRIMIVGDEHDDSPIPDLD